MNENKTVDISKEFKVANYLEKKQEGRLFLPTFSELVDRLTISQLKEVFITEHKEEYTKEIQDILHDIQLVINQQDIKIDANFIRDIIILAQYNLHIWHNESEARKGNNAGNNLILTHSLNGVRCRYRNKLEEYSGGRKDYKVDALAAEFGSWEPSSGT